MLRLTCTYPAVATILRAHSSAPTFLPSLANQSATLALPLPVDAFHPPSHFVSFLLQYCAEIRCHTLCLAFAVEAEFVHTHTALC